MINLKKENIIFGIIATILVIAGVFWFLTCVPIKTKIEKEMTGIGWKNEVDEPYQVTVDIYGTYNNYILELFNHHDYYHGDFEISGVSKSSKPSCAHFIFNDSPHTDMIDGTMTYFGESIDLLGNVYHKDVFSQVVLQLDDEMMCAFPASNLEEAKEIAKQSELK